MNTVIVDSDALIGLIFEADSWHKQCILIHQYLKKENIEIFIPYPIILEAATALARIVNRSDLAAAVLNNYVNFEGTIDTDVANLVAKLYSPKTSKKNTPFDYYILALAKKNNIKYIFSFDSFYQKNGLTLMEDVIG